MRRVLLVLDLIVLFVTLSAVDNVSPTGQVLLSLIAAGITLNFFRDLRAPISKRGRTVYEAERKQLRSEGIALCPWRHLSPEDRDEWNQYAAGVPSTEEYDR